MFERRLLQIFCCLAIASGVFLAPAARADFRDPTRPPTARSGKIHHRSHAVGRSRWTLTSTVVSPGRRLAVVNGTTMKVGQYLNGARLVEIFPHAVMLRRGSREFTLRFSSGRVKASVAGTEKEKRTE